MARGSGSDRRTDSVISRKRAERRAARGQAAPADWGSVDAERIVALISAVTGENGLCSFGYTRDGGTYTVTTILDGEKNTDYCRPTEDINAFLDDIIGDFGDLG